MTHINEKSSTIFKVPELNYTQIPNNLFDEWIPRLKEGELRVLLVIMRQTFGWQNKTWDRISVTQLMKKTGMKRWACLRSGRSLVKKGIIIRRVTGRIGQQETWYTLHVENAEKAGKSIEDSNILDQSPKETGLFRRPTKEKKTPKGVFSSSSPTPSSKPKKRKEKKKMRPGALAPPQKKKPPLTIEELKEQKLANGYTPEELDAVWQRYLACENTVHNISEWMDKVLITVRAENHKAQQKALEAARIEQKRKAEIIAANQKIAQRFASKFAGIDFWTLHNSGLQIRKLFFDFSRIDFENAVQKYLHEIWKDIEPFLKAKNGHTKDY